MEVVFCTWLFSIITLVNSAPTIIESADTGRQELEYNQKLEYLRGRRSNQYAVVSPCAAAAGAALPNYHPAYGYASHGYAPYMNNYAYPNYMPVHPSRVYRADDEEPEMMSFSDGDTIEHASFARYNYAPMPVVPAQYEAQSGPAYGVFPNANIGGYSIPLLVSCSPNVVQGRVMKAETTYANPSSIPQGYGYRLNDHHNANLNHQNTKANDHLPATSEGDAAKTQ